MASFKKRGETWTYYVKVGIDPRTGKRKQKSKGGFKTKKEAQTAAKKFESEFTFEGDRDPTFEELYLEWWETYQLKLKESTIQTFELMYRKHILPYFAMLRMKSIKRHHCQQFIESIARDLPGTVDTVKAKANQVFKYAQQEGIIVKNPMQHVVKPKRDELDLINAQQKRNFWNRHEVIDFLSRCRERVTFNDYALFYTLLYSGMRKGEALALKWDDVDFHNSQIRVNKTIFVKDGDIHIQRAKTVAGARYVSMDNQSIAILRKLYQGRSELYEKTDEVERSDIVFQRSDGRYMRLTQPNNLLNILIRDLDLHRINVHGMRHTHASLCFEAGLDIKDVQERLGHSDIKMTLDIYTHVTETKKNKSAQKFADFMESDKSGDKLVTLEAYRHKNSQ